MTRLRTVINPKFNPLKTTLSLSDFFAVPAIETIGTWPVKELLPRDQAAMLRLYGEILEGGELVTRQG